MRALGALGLLALLEIVGGIVLVLCASSALGEIEGIAAFCFGVLTIAVIRGIELLKTTIEKLPNEIAEAAANGGR
jgi:hypothetical protein